MKKNITSLTVVVMILAFVLSNLFAAQQAPRPVPPPDDFMIPKPEGIEILEKTIPFPHSVHAGFDCAVCHHTGDVTQSCTSAGCHDLFVPVTLEERRDIRFFEKAYHDRCIGCHRDLRKAQKPAGPVACIGCHPRPAVPAPGAPAPAPTK